MKFGKKVPSTLKIPLSWSVGDTGDLCQPGWISPKDGWHDDRKQGSFLLPPYSIGICSPVGGTSGEITGGSGGGA
jgi:hypothetical protein